MIKLKLNCHFLKLIAFEQSAKRTVAQNGFKNNHNEMRLENLCIASYFGQISADITMKNKD